VTLEELMLLTPGSIGPFEVANERRTLTIRRSGAHYGDDPRAERRRTDRVWSVDAGDVGDEEVVIEMTGLERNTH
jgi:hypothetical protein